MKRFGLTRDERLRGDRRIGELFEKGKAGFVFPFRYVVLMKDFGNPAEEGTDIPPAVLISVSKRYHKKANKRNLIKRRTREAYRLSKLPLTAENHGREIRLALIYSTKEILDYKRIENAVGRIITEIHKNI